MSEGPTVVGMMTSSLESGGSLDSAVRSVADEGPRISAGIFGEVVGRLDTRCSRSAAEELMDAVSSLPDGCSGYRRAVQMCVTASESGDDDERLRLLRDASDMALESVREVGESYSSSLTIPCMTVFGLGIMVPVILMSILPLLGIGGMFGSAPIDSDLLTVVTLFLIPSVILAVTFSMRARNPFAPDHEGRGSLRLAAPMAVAFPLMMVHRTLGMPDETALLYSVAPACILTLILMAGHVFAESRRERCAEGLRDSVLDVGNRLMSGENLERAMVSAVSEKKSCEDTGTALGRELALCRGDVVAAIWSALGGISAECAISFSNIHRCAEKDLDDAGRLAVSLGRQFQNRASTVRELERKLKEMTDMMVGVAMVFAPMILGLSLSMLGPLSEIADFDGLDGTSLTLALYLVELSAMISVLTVSLGRNEGFAKGLWRFCLMCPVALTVFHLCCGVSL